MLGVAISLRQLEVLRGEQRWGSSSGRGYSCWGPAPPRPPGWLLLSPDVRSDVQFCPRRGGFLGRGLLRGLWGGEQRMLTTSPGVLQNRVSNKQCDAHSYKPPNDPKWYCFAGKLPRTDLYFICWFTCILLVALYITFIWLVQMYIHMLSEVT